MGRFCIGWRTYARGIDSAPREIGISAIGKNVPLLEGLRTMCAIRRLKRDAVPPALVRKVVEAGTVAPSGRTLVTRRGGRSVSGVASAPGLRHPGKS